MSDTILTIDYNGALAIEFDAASVEAFGNANGFPAASIMALMQSGYNHMQGSEVSSSVVGEIKDKIKEKLGDATPEPGDKAAWKALLTTFRTEHPEQVKAWTEQYQAEMVTALRTGTIGVRKSSGPRGPRLSEFERVVRELAASEINVILEKAGLLAKNAAGQYVSKDTGKAPTGKSPLFNTGSGEFSFPQLVERRVTGHADRLGAEAKKRIEAAAKRAEKVAEGLSGL